MKRPTFKQVLNELLKKPRIAPEAREKNGDIEDAVEAAGGRRGSLNA